MQTGAMSPAGSRETGISGTHTCNGVPHGVTSLTPYVAVGDVAAAADFYRVVFGARIVSLTRVEGRAIHAQLDLGDGYLHLEAPNPDGGGLINAPAEGPNQFAFAFYCDDIGAVADAAVSRGAKALSSAISLPSGDRFVPVRDPYGVRWSITTRVLDLPEEESARRVSDWASKRSSESAG